eukprot:840779-Amphidinium_carterae.1
MGRPYSIRYGSPRLVESVERPPGDALHTAVWVQVWLASMKAKRTWDKQADAIVAQHKREWQSDLAATKACIARAIAAVST